MQVPTYTTHSDSDFISKNYKTLLKVSSTEYADSKYMNEQDKEDLKEIHQLEKIASIREKEGVLIDEQYLLEDDNFLFPEEIRLKSIKLFKEVQDPSYILLKDTTYNDSKQSDDDDQEEYLQFDPEKKVYTNVQLDSDFITIIKESQSKDINEFEHVYIYMRIPAYEIEDITRGLKQQITLKLSRQEVQKMKHLFSQYQTIICYTDGSCLGNPGRGGAGAVFTGRNRKETVDDRDSDQGLDDLLLENKEILLQ